VMYCWYCSCLSGVEHVVESVVHDICTADYHVHATAASLRGRRRLSSVSFGDGECGRCVRVNVDKGMVCLRCGSLV